MELNEPSGSGSGSHAEPSRLGAPVAHAPPDAARLPGAGRVEELEEDVQAVSTGQEIELRLQMDGGGRGVGPYAEKRLVGCGLHVLNLCDVAASDAWRQADLTNGDPYSSKPLVIGGKDKKESWAYFVCRFFSRALRWNVAWRS